MANRIVLAFALLNILSASSSSEEPAANTEEFYQQKIEPLLKRSCYECHSHATGEASGKLMVDSLTAMSEGGTRGRAVEPGKPEESWLMKAVSYQDPELQMPPDGQLRSEEIELLRSWIAAGAVAPKSVMASSAAGATSAKKPHWAYEPPRTAEIANASGTTAIDCILNKQLATVGLTMSPRADRVTLIRRLYYDLSGLPPTAEEIEAFATDPRNDHELWLSTIDKLLSRAQFGERWARYWMDVARYADTKGYVFQESREYPQAYRYRDWLISAFNDDRPYTEFVRMQLAADLVPEAGDANLPALGFLTLGRRFLNNKQDIIDDRMDVVSRGLMGMTMACARCHDHKYDPIEQADYYAMYGVFLNTEEPGGEPFLHRLADTSENRKSFVLVRGSAGNRGAEVPRRFVSFLSPDKAAFESKGSGRIELANKIVSDSNPLTARVMANRVWMRLMGTSLTESPSDFGTRCPPPLQLELLDQLALDFIRNQWSVKQLIREIVSSDAYQQQSLSRPEAYKVDAANTLYWRANRRRRDFESMRDSLLMASGQLQNDLFGAPEKIDTQPYSHRRTIYAYIDRQNLPNLFRSFDFASPDAHNPVRAYTSVPQQGLFMLNSGFVAELASQVGQQAQLQASMAGSQQAATELFRQILQRSPTSNEVEMLIEFVNREAAPPAAIKLPNWICGFAKYDPENHTIEDFKELPKFSAQGWHGNEGPPDPQLGWCILNAAGGHPGNDLSHVVVRRWIAPRDGTLRISGTLKHSKAEGDGVRSTILTDGKHFVKSWTAHNSETKTRTEMLPIQAGQSIDFVTDCLTEPSHDSFEWKVTLRYNGSEGASIASEKEFPLPTIARLTVWQQLAQALLASNEFVFVD